MEVPGLHGTGQARVGHGPTEHAGLFVQAGFQGAGARARIGRHLIGTGQFGSKGRAVGGQRRATDAQSHGSGHHTKRQKSSGFHTQFLSG